MLRFYHGEPLLTHYADGINDSPPTGLGIDNKSGSII